MSKLKTKTEAEAEALERGASILARSIFATPGGSRDVTELEKAIRILMEKEAERMRFELRGRRSIAHLFPDSEKAMA